MRAILCSHPSFMMAYPNQSKHRVLFFLFFFISKLFAQDISSYKALASSLELSNDPYWHLLLHANDGISEIDDTSFFLSSTGHIDPKSELFATLESLFDNTKSDDNATACRFPARSAWLKERLNLKFTYRPSCKELHETLEKLDPKSATLVFPAAHINSPASMFGHTFIRINSSMNSKLLSYAINYAANADPSTENALIFSIKGLFGGYFGRYSLLPYYEKLREYKDKESRDVWEYDLDLTPLEVHRMVLHMWELNGTNSYYYFFTENCSYNMLWLLEVARPSIHLREYFYYQVIPMESVHATNYEGIIKNSHYRPSKRSLLLKYESHIKHNYKTLPKEILSGSFDLEKFLNDTSIEVEQKN